MYCQKFHSTNKEIEGTIRNREKASLMFYFPLVKNIYLTCTENSQSLSQRTLTERHIQGTDLSIFTVFSYTSIQGTASHDEGDKSTGCLCTQEQHHRQLLGLPRMAKIPFLLNRPIGPPRNKFNPEQRRTRERQIHTWFDLCLALLFPFSRRPEAFADLKEHISQLDVFLSDFAQ